MQLWKVSTPNPHHKRPAEALEALVKLGGVGEQQEERCQELQQRDRHKSGRGGGREAHKRHKWQDLPRRVKKSVKKKGKCILTLWGEVSLLQAHFLYDDPAVKRQRLSPQACKAAALTPAKRSTGNTHRHKPAGWNRMLKCDLRALNLRVLKAGSDPVTSETGRAILAF